MMPGIFPRINSLFFSGFGLLPYLLALLCVRVRLLPKGHPFFHANKKYGIRDVLAEAARRLTLDLNHVDQVIVFGAIVSGVACLFAFILAMMVYIALSPVANASSWLPGIFVTSQPQTDVAFMMLDRIFGIPGIYDSEIITNVAKYGVSPNALQTAMHSLFAFFSWGLFIIATFIFLYYVLEIVWDVTQGTPLGDIMQNAWIPLRLVTAFGLLVPLPNAYGLNSAQYITLYTAKLGSGMATNAWGYFNMETSSNPLGMDNERLVAQMENQDFTSLLKKMMIMKACQEINSWNFLAQAATGASISEDGSDGNYDVQPYIVNGQQSKLFYNTASSTSSFLDPYGNKYDPTPAGVASGAAGDPFGDILAFSGGAGITLVMGYVNPSDPTLYAQYPGGVLPVCGEVYIPVTAYTPEALFAAEAYFYAVVYVLVSMPRGSFSLMGFEEDAMLAVARDYTLTSSGYKLAMQQMGQDCFFDTDGDTFESLDEATNVGNYLGPCTGPVPSSYWQGYLNLASTTFSYQPQFAARNYLIDFAASPTVYSIGDTSYSGIGLPDPMMMSAAMMQLGWGGAGLWYNRISDKNGSLVSAISAAPSVRKMPKVMEDIKRERASNDAGMTKGYCSQYSAEQASKKGQSNIANERAPFVAELTKNLHSLCVTLFDNQNIALQGATGSTMSDTRIAYRNPIEHAMAATFGQLKLFDPRVNSEVLPMAQLSAVGRALIDKSILSMVAAVGSAASGSLLHVAAASADDDDIASLNLLGSAFGQASAAALSFASIGLTVGFVLHYVLPFLPFVYFFFAVGRWVKTIFEAMVGVPLWALAHMRMSGPGLPGEAASGGYFLLLEIFVRPVITVVALVGSFAVFTAMAMALNGIFGLVTENFMGVDTPAAATAAASADIVSQARAIADQFFYSVMYVIILYMMATSSFKLIDIIPDNIMRWSGSGVSSMGASDNADDLIDQLQYQMPTMVNYYTKQVGGAVRETLYEPGKAVGEKAERDLAGRKMAEQQQKAQQEQQQKAQQEQQQKAQQEQQAAQKKNRTPPSDGGGNGGQTP